MLKCYKFALLRQDSTNAKMYGSAYTAKRSGKVEYTILEDCALDLL
jgi:hypothetical protein